MPYLILTALLRCLTIIEKAGHYDGRYKSLQSVILMATQHDSNDHPLLQQQDGLFISSCSSRLEVQYANRIRSDELQKIFTVARNKSIKTESVLWCQ